METQILDVDDMKKRSHLWVTACQNAVSHLEQLKYAFPIVSVDRGLRMISEREEREVYSRLRGLTLNLSRQFRELFKRPFEECVAKRHRRLRFVVERPPSPGRRSTLSIGKPRDRRLRVHGIVTRLHLCQAG